MRESIENLKAQAIREAKRIHENTGNIHLILDKLNDLSMSRPAKPTLPTPPMRGSAPEAYEEYAQKIREHQEKIDEWNLGVELYREYNSFLNTIEADYVKEYAGLDKVPDRYREKLYDLAYSYGHSSGYYEVYSYLYDLVGIFK